MGANVSQSRTFQFRRHAPGPDAEAFAAIVRLHGQMVYGVGLRITGDAHYAADVTQETFFHLLQNAGRVTDSLGGWLHQVATRRAIDLMRRDSSRHRREQEYALQTAVETDSWADLSPLVDEALSELDETSRDLIIRHFLQGENMVEIAAADGVSQPTVSRRVEQAVSALRERLRLKGALVAAGVLSGMLTSSTAAAMPAAVIVELGKMSALSAGAAGASAKTVLGALKVKIAAVALTAIVGGGAYLIIKSDEKTPPTPPTTVPTGKGIGGFVSPSGPPNALPATVPNGVPMVPMVAQQYAGPNQGKVLPGSAKTNTSPASTNRTGWTPIPYDR
jgi:RNA polymerase sigma factor (sigma-70 family)